MLNLFKSKTKGPLFICQITDSQIKIIKCLRAESKKEFMGLETEDIPSGLDDKGLAERLTVILKKLGYNGGPVTICLPRSKVTCRFLKVPTHVPKEIDEIVNLQAARFLPYPPEELITGYQVVATDKEGYSELNIVIMHKDVASRYINIFRELKSSGITIALSSYGLVNLYEYIKPNEFDPVMIIDVDYPQVELAVVSNQRLIFSRYFKIDKSRSDWEGIFIDEINKSRDLYSRDTSKEGPKKAFVILGSKGSQEVVQALNKHDGFSFETVSYDKISVSGDVRNKISFSDLSFASMIGLGLKDLDLSLNLLTADIKAEAKVSTQRNEWLRLGAAIGAIIIILSLAVAKSLDNKALYLKQIRVELSKVKSEAVSLEEIEKKFKFMEKSLKEKPSALDILYDVHQAIPVGITLVNLGYEENKEVVLRGQAPDLNSVFSLVAVLTDMPAFAKFNVKVRYATKKKTPQGEVINFEIGCSRE